jgi:fructose-1-phosphate kinase PfkB-like protein
VIRFLALSPSIDVTYEVPVLVRGEVNRPTSVTRVPGGKGLNAARVARAVGGDVRVVTVLGGAAGDWMFRELVREGIQTRVVTVAAETRTCLAIVEQGAATSSTDVYEPASALSDAEWSVLDPIISEVPAAWLALSGSVPEGVDLPELARGLLACRRIWGTRIAVDTSGAGLLALAPVADVIKVNRSEAAALVGSAGADAAADARAIHSSFGTIAIVTDGVRGGAAVSQHGGIDIPPPGRLGRFPVGSGDAFFGALLAALDGGAPLVDAVAAGATAGERNALVPGAGRLG